MEELCQQVREQSRRLQLWNHVARQPLMGVWSKGGYIWYALYNIEEVMLLPDPLSQAVRMQFYAVEIARYV